MALSLLLVLPVVLALAWANGSNDIAKGIATLVGNGTTSARRAVLWGTAWTLAGGLTSTVWGAALLQAFSTGYLNPDFPLNDSFVIGMAAGAAAWVLFATRFGLPVSTTHALLGGLIGAALAVAGPTSLHTAAVTDKALAPLLISPLMAAVACVGLLFLVRRLTGGAAAEPTPAETEDRNSRWSAMHWLSSGITSFARGLNDVPKIAALLVMSLALVPNHVGVFATQSAWPIATVAATMGLGCLWGGYRILNVLARRVTPLDAGSGLAANLSTSLLVLAASPLGLPVSTTHVSTGALLGVRWSKNWQPGADDALRMILFGWVVTLPIAALIAAATAVIV